MRDQLDAYRQEVGAEAADKQIANEQGRCSYCWALPGELHARICPNRPEDEEAAPPTQDEALF